MIAAAIGKTKQGQRINMAEHIDEIARMENCGVVPVLTIPTLESALPLANALLEGGLDVIEVTLRTPCAIDAINEMRQSTLDLFIGAGTILNENDVAAAKTAGAEFLVTPGTPQSLIPALQAFDGLVIPGASTTTEMLTLFNEGFRLQKLFPAELSGGAPLIKSVQGPLQDIRFMPTGGVREDNLPNYLSLKNVVAAGGTWIAPENLVAQGDWTEITARARAAREIVRKTQAT